ncbi:MAG: hypothetical protein SGI74_05560 [Oligoflexia bacterium]|nr:hypothetical protein [Oligoflexia bacterium]
MKTKILLILALFVISTLTLFLGYPRGASLILSYRKECKVMRVEPFLKGMISVAPGQAQKFSIVCDDGSVCRAEDTGFAGVKAGDVIEFRGFPEFGTFEEFGKCDHAQLIRLQPLSNAAPPANVIPESGTP